MHAETGRAAGRYPFSAIVGQERMKMALLVNAIHPAIGGVLIRGEKGSAKSTAVRSLAALLPDITVATGCPYACGPGQPFPGCPHCTGNETSAECRSPRVAELPIGATEDRVLGTLHVEHAIRSGERRFEPGLLAAAHRGILYVDEVNLLPDHLVDILLDAAAMGWNIVERDGISFGHPARFILIGTMNPEEGELRPQFLDRFGLAVDAEALTDPADRADVVRRRLAYEDDPAAFAARWADDERALCQRVAAAQEHLPHVVLPDDLLDLIAQICTAAGVEGLRADLTIARTALALAAYAERIVVHVDDIRTAAALALAHRQRQPKTPDGPLSERIEDLLREHEQRTDEQPDMLPPPPNDPSPDDGDGAPTRFDAAAAPRFALPKDRATSDPQLSNGRSGPPMAQHGPGLARGVISETRNGDSLAVADTLRAAAIHQDYPPPGPLPIREGENGVPLSAPGRGQGRGQPAIQIQPDDVRWRRRDAPAGHCVLFVVDASGSMAAEQRMAVAKGAALGLLGDAYRRRDHVGLIAFRGAQAELILPPTRSTRVAEERLRALPTGGRTPLAHALHLARETLARPAHAEQMPVVVVLSDGRANVPLSSDSPLEDAYHEARALRAMQVTALILDSETGPVRLGLAEQLANELGAEYRLLGEMEPSRGARIVRAALPAVFDRDPATGEGTQR